MNYVSRCWMRTIPREMKLVYRNHKHIAVRPFHAMYCVLLFNVAGVFRSMVERLLTSVYNGASEVSTTQRQGKSHKTTFSICNRPVRYVKNHRWNGYENRLWYSTMSRKSGLRATQTVWLYQLSSASLILRDALPLLILIGITMVSFKNTVHWNCRVQTLSIFIAFSVVKKSA